MTLEIYNKLQELIEDMDISDGATYSSWEVDILENMRMFAKQSNISFSQETKIEEIYDKHCKFNEEN